MLIRSTARAGNVNCRFKWLDSGKMSVLPLVKKAHRFGSFFTPGTVFAVLLKWWSMANQNCDIFVLSSKNGTTKTCRMLVNVPQ
jgi:hypothetical protein